MVSSRLKPEKITLKLRQAEVLMGQHMPRLDTVRPLKVVEQTNYRERSWLNTLKELKRPRKKMTN